MVIATVVRNPRDDDSTVRLNGQRFSHIVGACEVSDHTATAAKAGIQCSVALISHQREIKCMATICGVACNHDLAVSLNRDAFRLIPTTCKVFNNDSRTTERSVYATVAVKTGDRDIFCSWTTRVTANNDLSVRLKSGAGRVVTTPRDINYCDTAGTETRVKAPCAVKACHGEIAT